MIFVRCSLFDVLGSMYLCDVKLFCLPLVVPARELSPFFSSRLLPLAFPLATTAATRSAFCFKATRLFPIKEEFLSYFPQSLLLVLFRVPTRGVP